MIQIMLNQNERSKKEITFLNWMDFKIQQVNVTLINVIKEREGNKTMSHLDLDKLKVNKQ